MHAPLRGSFSRRGALRVGAAALAAVMSSALLATAPHAAAAEVASTPDSRVPQLAGAGYALAQDGDRTFVGGVFTRLGGKNRQNIGAYYNSTNLVDNTFLASTNGKVDAIAVDPATKRVFLGGSFTTVNGEPRANLAAVDLTTGALIQDWQADTGGAVQDVRALQVIGGRLYVGGRFSTIDGVTSRARLAAVSTTDGVVDLKFRPRPAGGVNEIKPNPDGTVLYLGGAFTALSGQPRNGAGSVIASTGDVTGFAPSGSGGNVVTIELSPNGQRFWYGTDNNTVFAYDPAVSNDPVYLFKMSGNTQAMVATDTVLYFGGHFSQSTTEKLKRAYFAAVDSASGKLVGWDPDALGGKMGVWDLQIANNKLHAVGVFSTFAAGTIKQRGYARFSVTP